MLQYIEYGDGYTLVSIVVFALMILFAIFVISFISKVLQPTGSRSYRKYLTNLYVAGKVKQLAKKDEINMDEIERDCLKYISKNEKRRIRELDDKIEAELIENVESSFEQKREQGKGKTLDLTK